MRRDIQFLFGQFIPRCTHQIDKYFEDYNVLQLMAGGAVNLTVGEDIFHLEGRWFWSSYPGPRIAFRPEAPHHGPAARRKVRSPRSAAGR